MFPTRKEIAPVLLIYPNGRTRSYGRGATNDTQRGVALTNAINDSTSDCIIFNYSNAFIDNINKTGLILYNYGRLSHNSTNSIVTDGGSAKVISILGPGTIDNTGAAPLIICSNASSVITIRQSRLAVSDDDGTANCVECSNGFLVLDTDSITSVSGDGLVVHNGFCDVQRGILSSLFQDGGTCNIWPMASYSLFSGGNPVFVNGTHQYTISIPVFASGVNVATGDGKAYYQIPPSLNAAIIRYVHAFVPTAGTIGTTDIQIARIRSGSPTDILTTKLKIDSTEVGTDTAATPAVIDSSNRSLLTNDRLRIDVDAVSSIPPQGLIITIGVEL